MSQLPLDITIRGWNTTFLHPSNLLNLSFDLRAAIICNFCCMCLFFALAYHASLESEHPPNHWREENNLLQKLDWLQYCPFISVISVLFQYFSILVFNTASHS